MQPNARSGTSQAVLRVLLGAVLLGGCAVSGADDGADNPFVVGDDPSTTDGSGSSIGDEDGEQNPSDGAQASNDGSASDGATGDGATGDGATGDGASTDGATGDGASTDGATGDGAGGDGAVGDGSTGDGSPDMCANQSCDDGIACTVDSCAAGSCSHTPDNSKCTGGATCSATAGCMATCSVSPCKLVSPQCGCSAGQGCYPNELYQPECAPAGAGAEGASCLDSGDCAAGMICLAATATTGQCYRMCNVNADCVLAGTRCVISLVDENDVATGIKACD